MSQQETPLFTGLLRHIQKNPLPFHIPGHKKGAGAEPQFREFLGPNALALDLINIEPLDDLHHPNGIILKAQQLAAEAFGADRTYFSVQGTSGAIMAMILSVLEPGDKILLPRNVHKSVLSAVIFSGAHPVFIYPEVDERLGISHGISTHSVRKALAEHPDARALFVINPTYYGIACDLKTIVEYAHQAGIPVLVDEAHGVHIHFHDRLPISAMQAGADMAATSVHKLGGSMTQSSVLNIKEGLISPGRVQAVFSMLMTTSTSYLLLASLDTARKQLAVNGYDLLENAIQLAQSARKQINHITGLVCVGREILGTPACYDFDPTKLLISVRQLGITGYDAEVWLREEENIEVELSDLYNILCLITPADNEQTVCRLIQALQKLAAVHAGKNTNPRISAPAHVPAIPKLALSPRDAFYAETESVPFSASAGRIAAEFVMVYPPGIPIFLPGEIITENNLKYIQENLEAGLPVQGPEDDTLSYLRVVKEIKPII